MHNPVAVNCFLVITKASALPEVPHKGSSTKLRSVYQKEAVLGKTIFKKTHKRKDHIDIATMCNNVQQYAGGQPVGLSC